MFLMVCGRSSGDDIGIKYLSIRFNRYWGFSRIDKIFVVEK